MAILEDVHLGDIGTAFTVTITDKQANGTTIVADISSATLKQLVFKKPNGNKLTKTAAFVTDGTDGKITYTTISGDIDIIGTWKLQGIITIGSNIFNSEIKSFKVNRNL